MSKNYKKEGRRLPKGDKRTPAIQLGDLDAMAEAQRLGKEINDATTMIGMDKAIRKFNKSFESHTELKEKTNPYKKTDISQPKIPQTPIP